jgi:putative Mg2+ transporter-C (MgtC) family protein
VKGLTTAATLFAGAAIGMAAGGGFYAEAGFATALVFVALFMLGLAERRFSSKHVHMTYEIVGDSEPALIEGINLALEAVHKMMQKIEIARADGHVRLQFTIDATRQEHDRVLPALQAIPGARNALCLGVEESD